MELWLEELLLCGGVNPLPGGGSLGGPPLCPPGFPPPDGCAEPGVVWDGIVLLLP